VGVGCVWGEGEGKGGEKGVGEEEGRREDRGRGGGGGGGWKFHVKGQGSRVGVVVRALALHQCVRAHAQFQKTTVTVK